MKRARWLYKLVYWSTRQQGDIQKPYGKSESESLSEIHKQRKHLLESPDIYKMEIWKRFFVMEREKVIEEYHGNKAHLRNYPE